MRKSRKEKLPIKEDVLGSETEEKEDENEEFWRPTDKYLYFASRFYRMGQ